MPKKKVRLDRISEPNGRLKGTLAPRRSSLKTARRISYGSMKEAQVKHL